MGVYLLIRRLGLLARFVRFSAISGAYWRFIVCLLANMWVF